MLKILSEPPAGLSWSAPPEVESEFSVEDPLAFDYLSQQVGLWLFPGFTTRTNRAQNYAVVLYGLHLAERAIDVYGYSADDDTRTRLFERWEKFWALATMESRNGELDRGDDDTMRGVRGAKRNWYAKGDLGLNFELISRQSELGGLGAYLSSLRTCRLVHKGTLRPSLAADDIIACFWGEKGKGNRHASFEAYALEAMDLDRVAIERKWGTARLEQVGERTRLSCLGAQERAKQQERLWAALFLNHQDSTTLPLTEARIEAIEGGVTDVDEFFEGVLSGRWSKTPSHVKELVDLGLHYRGMVALVLGTFDKLYGYVYEKGVADRSLAAASVFEPNVLTDLHKRSADLRTKSALSRFAKLEFHGPPFLRLLNELAENSDAETALGVLLRYHTTVQRTRRGAAPWILEQENKLVLQLSGYRAYKADVRSPSFKVFAVDRLLRDLGKV